ncbi:hypothetical protein ACE7GA_22105 [Roseomonas sp. CCTCC AB2023176]|uniref:hypothetical protein n=1 Tax=Roseomonas sp. CCTCC AB2023176 TaxID=3342640 RepID=UPI0035DFC0B8
MGDRIWRKAAEACLVSENRGGLRLIVTKVEAPATVRFVVEEKGAGTPLPVLSGYRDSVAAAMRAAEEGASRIAGA